MIPLLEPMLSDFKPRTIAWLIQRVIDDVSENPTTINQHGTSQLFGLRRLQREPIGKVMVDKLTKHDIQNHCKERRKTVCPATVKQDISFLRGVITHAASSFPDCEELTCAAFEAAKKFLVKNNLVGKSTPRKRRPTDAEIDMLLADLTKSDAQANTQIKMVPIVLFALASARRRGEIVRITHGDVDYEKKVYWVRDVKHPTKKRGNDKAFALWPEIEQLVKMQPRLRPDDPNERIFPYNGESIGKRYIDAKKRCKIVGLRFHDNRREAVSRYLLKLGSPDKVRKLVSGHDSLKIFETVYDGRTTVEIMQADAAVMNLLTPKPQPTADCNR